MTSLKSRVSQRLLTSSPTILVVLLALASVWHTEAVHTFEYHGQTRWSGPWDNPNLFGLLMGTGAALAAGFGLQRWKMEDGRFNNCSSRRKEALTAEKPALSKAYLSLLTSAATRNGIIKHALSQYVPAVFCLVAFGFMARGLFHSYSRGAWLATACGMGYLFFNSEFRIQNSELSRVSWLRRNWLPLFVVAISVVVLGFWHFRETEWHPARRAFSAVNEVDFSWRNRVTAWEGALQIMAEHPWFGAGWNQPEPLYQSYYLSPKLQESAAIEMNDYLMLGSTLGIPALFCFAAYIWLCLTQKSGVRILNPESGWGARPPRASFFAPSRKTSFAAANPEREAEVGCGAHPTTPGAGVLPATCRAGAIVLLVGFWFDGGLFKLATASTFWILLELGRQDFTMDRAE